MEYSWNTYGDNVLKEDQVLTHNNNQHSPQKIISLERKQFYADSEKRKLS